MVMQEEGLYKESFDIYTACCVCDLFKLNCGLFSPLSAVVCTVVNTTVQNNCRPFGAVGLVSVPNEVQSRSFMVLM